MNLLNFLVTSETRKELLRLLWVDNLETSGYQLAQLVRGAYSSVHDELEAMKDEGLVSRRRQGRAHVFKKNNSYPGATVLATLLDAPKVFAEPGEPPLDEEVRLSLARFGAPLAVHGESKLELPLEETLAYALSLARRDGTVARVLPVVLAKNRDLLDLTRLEFLARRESVLSVLGLFLDLTASLMKSRTLGAQARRLLDRRRKHAENFFVNKNFNSFEKELAEMNTPPVARNWHFLMNMGMDSFKDVFQKSYPEAEQP